MKRRLRHALFGATVGSFGTFMIALPVALDSIRHARNTALVMAVGGLVGALWFATKRPDDSDA